MITHNHLYEEICSFENLLGAARRAERGKRMQDTIGRFRTDLEAELFRLRRELVDKTYAPGPYRETIITRPKLRMISAAHYRCRRRQVDFGIRMNGPNEFRDNFTSNCDTKYVAGTDRGNNF